MKCIALLPTFLMCLVGLAGCATEMSESLYVFNSEQSKPVVTSAQHGETLAQRVPASSESLTFSGRLIGRLEKNGTIYPGPSFARGYRSQYGFKTETSELKRRGLIDVAVEIDMRGGVPVYRFVLTPQLSIKSKHVAYWDPIARVRVENKRGKNKSFSLLAPLPEGERLKNGQIITPWVYCGRCFVNEGSYSLKNDDEYFRLYNERIDWLKPMRNYKRSINIVGGFSLLPENSNMLKRQGIEDLSVGDDLAESARQAFIHDYADYKARVEQSKLANRAYQFFIDNKYAPLTMWEQFEKADCPKYLTGANINQTPDYNRKYIRQNKEFIRCARSSVDSYNFEAFVAVYPELIAREETLWEKTYGIERQKIDNVEGQLQYAKNVIDGAYNGIENIQRYINVTEERYARERRQREITMNAFNDVSQKFAGMMAESRNKQVVVTADGRVSTVGREQERAVEQGRMQAYLDANKKEEKPRDADVKFKSSELTKPPEGEKADREKNAVPSAAPSAQSQKVKPAVAPVASDGDDTLANQEQDQRMTKLESQIAKKKAREQELQQQLEERKEREFGVATARVKEKPQAVVPMSGGMNGCVTLLAVKRYPGKSPLGSCSYDQPERLSTEFRFRNSCELPVDIHLEIDYDDGSSKPSAEYGIKSGKARTTISYCGLSDYSFTYEETRESVRRRSQ